MNKSPDAFRTISEVSDWLDTPAHVLRFWESKFTQIKPVKRAGGRRYYRPEDMALLAGIKTLLHEQGMTIKGVQKLLREKGVREKGVRHVAGIGPEGEAETEAAPMGTDIYMPDDHGDGPDMPDAAAPPPAVSATVISKPPASPPMHAARPAHLPRISMPPTAMPPPADVPRMAEPLPVPQPEPAATQPGAPARPRPLPALPEERPALPGLLSRIAKVHPQTIAARRARIVPVLDRLAALRDRMAQDQA